MNGASRCCASTPHTLYAALPAQFDEYIWFDETTAVLPLKTHELIGMPESGCDVVVGRGDEWVMKVMTKWRSVR